MIINTAPNSPFKGYLPNVNPYGVSPRYTPGSLSSLYTKVVSNRENDLSNDSVKAIDRDKANIEAERDEVLLTFKPTGLALHKIQGKPHTKGGTPLNVPDGSFIFSKDKSMALTEEEIETYKLGDYQKGGLVKNSPAHVLKRNVDIKHNNRMIDYLQNSKNYAEKTTAMKMLQKYQEKIGTIAALQESRKQGAEIPEFAILPFENPQIKQEEDRQEQYSQGGWVLPKAQLGIQVKKKGPYLTNQERLFQPFSPQSVQAALATQIQNPQLVEPKKSVLEQAANRVFPNYSPDVTQEQVKAPDELDIKDDLSWIKPYDMTPKLMSMVGNLMQSPRSFYPALALQTPANLRQQTFDAQPGINAAMAAAYTSRKANSQYAPQSLQNNQLIDTEATRNAQTYANQIDRMNQSNAAEIHNQNQQFQNQALNVNNQARAQYKDKLNELYQNVSDTRNTIGATNMNLMGEALNEKQRYDTSVDFMKRYQPWKVEQAMSQENLTDMMQKYNQIKQTYGDMSEVERAYILKSLMAKYQKNTNNNSAALFQMMNDLNR